MTAAVDTQNGNSLTPADVSWSNRSYWTCILASASVLALLCALQSQVTPRCGRSIGHTPWVTWDGVWTWILASKTTGLSNRTGLEKWMNGNSTIGHQCQARGRSCRTYHYLQLTGLTADEISLTGRGESDEARAGESKRGRNCAKRWKTESEIAGRLYFSHPFVSV